MSSLEWKDEYSVGHYPIDHEHRQLVALAERVIKFSNDNEPSEHIRRTIKALFDYTKIHFRNEEAYMQRIGFDGLTEHQACHAELIAKMEQITFSQAPIDELVPRLKKLMVVWVIDHMIREDQKYAAANNPPS